MKYFMLSVVVFLLIVSTLLVIGIRHQIDRNLELSAYLMEASETKNKCELFVFKRGDWYLYEYRGQPYEGNFNASFNED